MPDETNGALGSPASAQAAATTLPENAAASGFPLNSKEQVQAALARSLEILQPQSPPADPTATVAAEEPPLETAADPQEQSSETLPEAGAEPPAEPEAPEGEPEEAGKPPGWQKRIDRLTAQKTELETRLAELEAQLAAKAQEPEAAPAPASVPGANPLAHVTSPAKLQEIRRAAEEAVEWADTQLINMEADADQVIEEVAPHAEALGLPKDRETWTPGLVKRALLTVKKNADARARKHVPAQAQFLIERHKAEQAAAKTFPWWNDPKAPEHQAIANSMQQYPWAQTVPGIKYAFGLMVEGHKAVQARLAAAQGGETAKPPALPPKTVKRPSVAPSRVPAEKAHTEQLRQRMATNPDGETLMKILTAQLQQSVPPKGGS